MKTRRILSLALMALLGLTLSFALTGCPDDDDDDADGGGDGDADTDSTGECDFETYCGHYIGCGWSPQNLSGMLDYYQRRELPSTRPKQTLSRGINNGQHRQHSNQTDHHVATLADFDLTPTPDQDG